MARRWPLSVFLTAVLGCATLALGITVNVATGGDLPKVLEPYRGWAWALVIVFGLITVGIPVWQLLLAPRETDGLPSKLVPAQLPPDIPDFTGRDQETELLQHILGSPSNSQAPKVAIIQGIPGIGMTALAIHAAHKVAHRFPDGQLYADLYQKGPVDLATVLDQFLRALGIPRHEIPASLDARAASYRTVLSQKKVLIVLANTAMEEQLELLIPASPNCGMIITTRKAPVGALYWATLLRLNTPAPSEAVRLISNIAGADRAATDLDAIARIAELCEYLPLALRLAGARLAARPHLTPAELARDLEDQNQRLDHLDYAYGNRGIRGAFQVTYEVLDSVSRRTFRLLALLKHLEFDNGSVVALTGAAPKEAEQAMEALVDAQLVELMPVRGRYRLHRLLHLFAHERLLAEEDPEQQQAAHERLLAYEQARR